MQCGLINSPASAGSCRGRHCSWFALPGVQPTQLSPGCVSRVAWPTFFTSTATLLLPTSIRIVPSKGPAVDRRLVPLSLVLLVSVDVATHKCGHTCATQLQYAFLYFAFDLICHSHTAVGVPAWQGRFPFVAMPTSCSGCRHCKSAHFITAGVLAGVLQPAPYAAIQCTRRAGGAAALGYKKCGWCLCESPSGHSRFKTKHLPAGVMCLDFLALVPRGTAGDAVLCCAA